MRVLLIDNYDSFAHNLVQGLRVLGAEVEVFRNDALSVDEALARPDDRIVISPGPCTPREAGISVDLCRRADRPLLGVCLGFQSLVVAFGGTVGRASRVVHGKTSEIRHGGRGLFRGLPVPLVAARYHSLVATEIPSDLETDAWLDGERVPMAVHHRERPLFGVLFHPESFLTPQGCDLLRNFLESPAP